MNYLNFEFGPQQITPLLATPRTLALLFVGAAFNTGYLDPHVRDELTLVRHRLRHWASLFKPSIKLMGSLAVLGAAAGAFAYNKTKINLWLVGSAIMLSLWPYTMLVLQPTNYYLLDVDARLEKDTELVSAEKHKVLDKLKYWVNGHRPRILIALLGAVIFYLAQLKSSEATIVVK